MRRSTYCQALALAAAAFTASSLAYATPTVDEPQCRWHETSFWSHTESAASRLAACLEHGTDPDARDSFRRTVAFHAARANAPGALEVLARHGATLDLAIPSGKTPLHAAAGADARESAAWLVRAGLDPTVADHFDQTPGEYAKNMGHRVLGKRLETLPSPRRCAWMTESFWALGLSLENALQECHGHGYQTTAIAPDGTTTMHLAVRLRPEEAHALRKLIEMGASPTHQDDTGVTPAHILATIDAAPALEVLIAEGGEIDRPNIDGERPIDLAAAAGRSENVKILIEAGADVTRMSVRGMRPIHYAAAGKTEGHLESQRIIEAAMPKETKHTVIARAHESPARPPAGCSDKKRVVTAVKNASASAALTCGVGAMVSVALSFLDGGLVAAAACAPVAAATAVVVVADAVENERCETAIIGIGKVKF